MKLTYFFHTAMFPHWWVAPLIALGAGLTSFVFGEIEEKSGSQLAGILLVITIPVTLLALLASFLMLFVNFATDRTDTSAMTNAITANYKVDNIKLTNENDNSASMIITSSTDHKPYTCQLSIDKIGTKHTSYFPTFDKLRQVDGTLLCNSTSATLEHK